MKTALIWSSVAGLTTGAGLAWFAASKLASTAGSQKPGTGPGGHPPSLASGSSTPILKAWQDVTGSKGGFGQRLGLMAIVGQSTSEDIPLLLAQSKDNTFARELLLLRWVEIDPAAAAEWISPALRDPNAAGLVATQQDAERVLAALAKRDPAAAMELVESQARGYAVNMFRSQIIGSVLAEDMEAGLKLMSAERPGMAPMEWMNFGDTAWVLKDPSKAVLLLGGMPNSDFRNESLMRAIGEVGIKDMAAGLALLAKYPDLPATRQQMWGDPNDSRAPLFEKWAKEDMTAMIAFVNDRAQGTTRSAMKEAIAKVLGEGDPKVALAWAADNLSGPHRHNAVNSLVTRLTNQDPAAALEYLVSLPSGTSLDAAVNAYTAAKGSEDPAAALARVRALPEGAARSSLMQRGLLSWYGTDPSAALVEAARQPPGSLPKEIWGNLGSSARNLADGMKQIEHVPAERAPDFVRGLFSNYNVWNLDGTEKFAAVEQLKDPALRKPAIEAVLGSWGWRDPTAAAEWAARFPSADERQQARLFLEQPIQRLPAEERDRLLGPLN